MTTPKRWLRSLLLLTCAGVPPRTAVADLAISSLIAPTVITFEATVPDVSNGPYAGTGFQPSPTAGQLDSNSWAIDRGGGGGQRFLDFDGTRIDSGVFARGASTGGVTPAGFYSFDVGGGNRTFGVQQDGGGNVFVPDGTLTLRVKNTTGGTVSSWNVAYDIFVFNDQSRLSSINFSYSTDDSTYSPIGAVDFTTPSVPISSTWTAATPRSTPISVPVPNNGNLYLRWTFADVSGSGDFKELGLDNISVGAAAIPEPGAALFGMLVCVVVGLRAGWRQWDARLRGLD